MEFFNLYNQGFIKSALCLPEVRVADPMFNAESTIKLAAEAADKGAVLALFPELGISAYSNEDLFHQEALLAGVLDALKDIIAATKNLNLITVVGAPLQIDTLLFNCGIVIYNGKIRGVAVKSYLPNYREFYEGRQFHAADEALCDTINLCGQEDIPLGANLIFNIENINHFKFYIEICEDLWVPIPPSSYAALAGATVLGNLSASNITVGKAEYRHNLVSNQSSRTLAAYLYTAAGPGESTTDLAWDGHAIIYENGTLLAETERFSRETQIIYGDIDLDRLAQDRMRLTGFGKNAQAHRDEISRFRTIRFPVEVPKKNCC